MKRISPGQRASDLVHDAQIRLHGRLGQIADGQHYIAAATRMMRNLLVDHARRAAVARRAWALTPPSRAPSCDEPSLLDIDAALSELRRSYPRRAWVVEFKFFGGLSNAEVATTLGVAERTVERDWSLARRWLRRQLGERS